MREFPGWRVRSICGNMNALFARSKRAPWRVRKISWGRSMEANCRLMLTVLRQNEIQKPEDAAGWIHARVRSSLYVEKVRYNEECRWDGRIYRECNRVSGEEVIPEGETTPFRMRAYLETSKLQFMLRNTFHQERRGAATSAKKALMEYRRLLKREGHERVREPCSAWQLCYKIIRRTSMKMSDSWSASVRSNCRRVNDSHDDCDCSL